MSFLCRFLSVLEEEIYAPTSPIWDPEFRPLPPVHLQASLAENKTATVRRGGEFEKITAPPNDKEHFTTINVTPGAGYPRKGIRQDSEKRLGESASPGRPEKRRKIEDFTDDISESTIAEIIATIDDPREMAGPQVNLSLTELKYSSNFFSFKSFFLFFFFDFFQYETLPCSNAPLSYGYPISTVSF